MATTTEDSGGSVSYYVTKIDHPWGIGKEPYEAECGEISEALGLTSHENNIFKEIWRKANARKGKKKKGNNPKRSVEKIQFFADRLYNQEMNNDNSD
jgi:hypothetical protein